MKSLTPSLRSPQAKPDGCREVTLVIPGPPRTKKNSGNIMMAGKRKIVKPSEAWLAWRDHVRFEGISVHSGLPRTRVFHGVGAVLFPDGRFNASAVFYRDARRGDAAGYYQGVADVLEELLIVADDAQITQWDGSRLALDPANARVVITLTSLPQES